MHDAAIHPSQADLAEFCRRWRITELAVFGSVLRDDFRPDSDLDLLVLFAPDAPIGFLEFAAVRRELSALLGRDVDLVSKRGLKPAIRDEVLASARVLYGAK